MTFDPWMFSAQSAAPQRDGCQSRQSQGRQANIGDWRWGKWYL